MRSRGALAVKAATRVPLAGYSAKRDRRINEQPGALRASRPNERCSAGAQSGDARDESAIQIARVTRLRFECRSSFRDPQTPREPPP
jgi:hypothetical protein